MLRHLPNLSYSGLTLILSQPSRHDHHNKMLLSGGGGHMFCDDILYPLGVNRYQCDIREATDTRPLITGTKCVLCLGERAMKMWMGKDVEDNTLNEFRGSPLSKDGITYIASFSAQDALDKQNYESRLNPDLLDWAEQVAKDKADNNPLSAKKHKGLTLRSNYKWWLRRDTAKIISILHDHDGKIPQQAPATYHIYPPLDDAIRCLSSNRNRHLYFDMETLYEHPFKMTCFSFGFDLNEIYVIPIINHRYEFAYDPLGLGNLICRLQASINTNTLVAHNGACFDFFVLAKYYSIRIGSAVYDTMIAAHRMFPEVEKSLGHVGSYATMEQYHKDEAGFAFGSRESAERLWAYCGKDVSLMMRIHEWQKKEIAKDPGLQASVAQAMASIRPYLIMTLQGIQYDEPKLVATMAENDALMMQYLRIIRLLMGEQAWQQLKAKSKKAMPTSNKQCCTYFHDMLGYPIVGRSKKGKKAPSLDEKNLLKLRLKNDNPVIDYSIKYRQLAKETGSLKFLPWRVI
jgi:hypothetical protein